MAAVVGGYAAGQPRVSELMVWGARLQIVTGVILVGMAESIDSLGKDPDMAKIGVKLNIRTEDFATWLDDQAKGNFDAFMLGWLGNLDPQDLYYSQHHSEGGNNYQSYSNPEVDRALEAAGRETDEERRQELYNEAVKMIVDKVISMPAGHKSEKQQALDAQKGGAPAPGKGEETDLGGDLGGK